MVKWIVKIARGFIDLSIIMRDALSGNIKGATNGLKSFFSTQKDISAEYDKQIAQAQQNVKEWSEIARQQEIIKAINESAADDAFMEQYMAGPTAISGSVFGGQYSGSPQGASIYNIHVEQMQLPGVSNYEEWLSALAIELANAQGS